MYYLYLLQKGLKNTQQPILQKSYDFVPVNSDELTQFM